MHAVLSLVTADVNDDMFLLTAQKMPGPGWQFVVMLLTGVVSLTCSIPHRCAADFKGIFPIKAIKAV